MSEQLVEECAKPLALFNTLTGRMEPFKPLDPSGLQVNMYVCGPTVYDDAHLGHARCYITWDVLYRFLKYMGYTVKYVRNVTDVDDKILKKATELKETPAQVAQRHYQSFAEDMKALNVLSPDAEPRATEYISAMLSGIEALIAQGAAYPTADGSVYFRVSAKPDYGKLKFMTRDVASLKKHLEDLKSGARVDIDEGKESLLDFALWKAAPLSDRYGWESPWPDQTSENKKGWGRPGWHMECSAMNHAIFGKQIDIHAGGADLIFPHHENEIAQSEAWSGLSGDTEQNRFAKYWLHNGFVNVSGKKMSKSLGNFSSIKNLLKIYDVNTIKLFLLTNGYRKPVNFDGEALDAAQKSMQRIHSALIEANQILGYKVTDLSSVYVAYPYPLSQDALNSHSDTQRDHLGEKSFFAALEGFHDNLSTSRVLEQLHQLRTRIEQKTRDWLPEQKNELVQDLGVTHYEHLRQIFAYAMTLFNLLGFSTLLLQAQSVDITVLAAADIAAAYQVLMGERPAADQSVEASLERIVALRKEAKALKNWAQADTIRKTLTELGFQLLDNKDGTTVIEKDGLEIVRV